METCTRELVGDRLNGYHRECLAALALIKALDGRIVAHREVSGFYEGPAQVLVAATRVSGTLGLTVRLASALDHPGVGGELAGRGELAYLTGLERDRHCQDIADPAHRLQCFIVSAGQAEVLRQAIANYRRLKKLPRGWEAETERLIDAAAGSQTP